MNYVIIAAIFLLVLIFDYYRVLKGKKDRSFWCYTLLIAASFTLLLLYESGIRMTAPVSLATRFLSDMLNLK